MLSTSKLSRVSLSQLRKQFSSLSLLSYCLTTDVELLSKTGKEGSECNLKISDGNFMLSFDPSPC